MGRASEPLFALKPVTFRYRKNVDPGQVLSFGLIAEDVAQIDPELVTLDKQGKPETVRYEAVNAMLLNEFLKEHRKAQEQQVAINALTSKLKVQQKSSEARFTEQRQQIEQLAAELQNVSNKVASPRSGGPQVAETQ
jgi:septal ring factor EnvC (AmiA/AmiB activator)